MKALGITWNTSELVTFDPVTGIMGEKHVWLPPKENFVGLAYDSRRNMLYALSQVNLNLYTIGPLSREIRLVGKLPLDSGRDVTGLTYDQKHDALYTVVVDVDMASETKSSLLASINRNDASTAIIGKIADGVCSSLCWRDHDCQLNAFLDSATGCQVVSINPSTAATTVAFQTGFHILAGLAKKPGQDGYYSWLNKTDGHFFCDVNLSSKKVTVVAGSDAVGVASGAMMARTFYVAPAPNLPCSYSEQPCPCRIP